MRALRTLSTAAAMVGGLLLLAFGAPAASAQAVEMSNETTGEHCSDVTMVGHEPAGASCTVRIVSERPYTLWLHNGMAEVAFSGCSTEFEAAFNEDGDGYIYNQVLTPEGGACGREPCDEGEAGSTPHKSLAWPVSLSESGGGLVLAWTFCLYAHSSDPATEGTAGTPCQVNVLVTDEGNHDWEVGTPAMDQNGNGGAPCTNLGGAVEWDGHWLVERNENHPDSFEVEHL
ncbi:MAG: hypothetical protein GXY03_13900 [Solirubrobacterales bacterium]|nr:hypothetical protein [Solirubrobacterales bacterium]